MKNYGFRLFTAGALLMGAYLIIYRGIRSGSDTWPLYLEFFVLGFSVAALLFWFPKDDFPPSVFLRGLFSEGGDQGRENSSTNGGEGVKGEMAIRLRRCIEAFPHKYPEYRTRRPKLDTDIRPWIKDEFGASDREAHVFGAMVAEHFDLSSDTQKSKQ